MKIKIIIALKPSSTSPTPFPFPRPHLADLLSIIENDSSVFGSKCVCVRVCVCVNFITIPKEHKVTGCIIDGKAHEQ